MGGDLLRIVEAAYTLECDTQAWLEGIFESAKPFDVGGGLCSYLVRFESDGNPSFLGMANSHAIDFNALWPRLEVPPEVARGLHVPAPRILWSGVDLPKILHRCQSSIPELETALQLTLPPVEVAMGGDDRHALVICSCSRAETGRTFR